ncbi:MAG: VWA domain-containing protein [Planctomycetes bacterium]|nr:VWA domain-containing protein [Planctomycetota bacterium]
MPRLLLTLLLLLVPFAPALSQKLDGEAAKAAKARVREIKKDWKKHTKAQKLPLLTELGRLPESSVSDFLQEVIQTEADDDTAGFAARELARHGDPADAKDLLKLVGRAQTPARKAVIVRWLGQYSDKATVNELRKLAMGDDVVAESAVLALCDINTPDCWSTVDAVAQTGKNGPARRAAAFRMIAAGDKRGVDAIEKLAGLEDAAGAAHAAVGTDLETAAVKQVLVHARKPLAMKPGERPHLFGSLLARIRLQATHDAVAEALPGLHKSLDIETGWWLVGHSRGQARLATAERWLGADEPDVIINGLRVLQRAPKRLEGAELKAADAALEPLLAHASEDVQIHTLLTCATTGAAKSKFEARVMEWLKSDQPLRRAAAILSAGRAGIADHGLRALELLKDDSWYVVSAALDYLLRLRPHKAAGPVLELAKTQGDGRLFAEAIALLVDLTGQDHGDAIDKWEKFLAENGDFTPLERRRESLRGVPYKRMKQKTAATFYGLELDSTNVVFCLDRSISMISAVSREPSRPDFPTRKQDVLTRRPEVSRSVRDGFLPRMYVAACEVSAALDGMSTGAKFGLLLFNTDLLSYAQAQTTNSTEERRKAVNWLLSTQPQGGTDIQAAVIDAIKRAQADTIVLLSDGEPTSLGILEQISRANEVRRLNILVVSIHEKVHYRHYQDAMAWRDAGKIVDGEPRD